MKESPAISEESMQVLRMLSEGKITVEQANRLLRALDGEPSTAGQPSNQNRPSVNAVGGENRPDAAFAKLDPRHFAAMRAVGVDTAYVREMREAGLANLDTGELVALRSVGVDAAYIRELREAGLADLDAGTLIALRGVGVDAGWIQ